jgi:hypothetical protein
VYRKGYVAFQRRGGYNTMIVDVYWRKTPRFAVKLPDNPAALSLVNPYPDLEETWHEDEREWGWTLGPLDIIPDLRPAVEIAERFHPSAGPTIDGADREQVRQQLRSGLTPSQVYAAMGNKHIYWLTVIEEEARLENELASYPATPEALQRSATSTSFAGNGSPRVSSATPDESRKCAASMTKRTDRALPHAPTPAVAAVSRKWGRSRSSTQPHGRG